MRSSMCSLFSQVERVEDEDGLRVGVGEPVVPVASAELELEPAVSLGKLGVGKEQVSEAQVLALPGAPGAADVDLDVARPAGRGSEVAMAGLAEAQGDAERLDRRDVRRLLLDVRYADLDVDHRLRRQPRDSRRADVVDPDGSLAERRGEALPPLLVAVGPRRVVGHDLDRIAARPAG